MIGIVLGIAAPLLARLRALGSWLTANPARTVVALLIALCAFLSWRLASVDGDRDDWRALAKQYETASQIVEEADAAADAEARDVAAETKGTIDAATDRAQAAAAASDDPLAAGLNSLRKEGQPKGD
jgi:predicted negative regulator of RcsB-dependent stress response